MPVMTITPSFINPVKAGKKMGTVKLPDDTVMLARAPILSQMQPRGTYEVTYTDATEDFNFRTITAVKPKGAAPAPGDGGAKYGVTDDVTKEHIFVCGAINNALQGGQVQANKDDVTRFGLELREAYKAIFKTAAPPPAATRTRQENEEEMNDQIPF